MVITYFAPLWLNIFGIVSVSTYLILFWRISERMKKMHNSVWEDLLRPFSFDLNSIASMWKLGVYVLITGKHRKLGDQYLSRLVYAARCMFMVCAIFAILAHQIGHQVTVPA